MVDLSVKCPNCDKSVDWLPSNRFRPFCSERCKIIDLGEWAAERRSISGSPEYFDLDRNEPSKR